jgi:integrase
MAKAKKLPSGMWRVLLYDGKDENGKRIYKSFTAATKKKAEADAALYSIQKKKQAESGMTVGEAIDAYIASKENVLSPTTINGYRGIRKNNLQGIMDVPIDEISNAMVQSAINKDALRLSPKSLRNAHGLLSAALAVYNPDLTLRTTLPAKEHKIVELPSPEDVIASIKGTDVELPCLLAIWLSLRVSEIRGLKYSDINNGMMTVRTTKVTVKSEDIVRNKTKTYSSTRLLSVPPYIMNLIEKSKDGNDSDFIVPLARQTIRRHFQSALQTNGVKVMRFHDLRHLNASVMLQLGIPDKYAMERGGWSTPDTLKQVYQHTFDEKRKEVDRQIDDYFEKLL